MENKENAFRVYTCSGGISEWRIAEMYGTEDNPAFFRDFSMNKITRHNGKNYIYGLPYEKGFETSAAIRAWRNPCVWFDKVPKGNGKGE